VSIASAFAPATALADGTGRVELDRGETIELEVGNALGWFCDEPSLVSAEIVFYDGHNAWVVTGVNAGATRCRVGTTVGRASYLFEVVVR
jgi:hypothetical protein